MSLREFATVDYLPILSIRPAEMDALQELPDRDKNILLPHILIRPWLGSHELRSSMARLQKAYGNRPVIAEVCAVENELINSRRPVHDELDVLRQPQDGYARWFDFIGAQDNLIPCIQIGNLDQAEQQVQRFAELGRGLVIRIPEQALSQSANLAFLAAQHVDPSLICINFDYERENRHFHTKQIVCIAAINRIRDMSRNINIAVSASSFPDSFVGVNSQEIYERIFFNEIRDQLGVERLIYSDRGSARAERQVGGGGTPAPRVDLALDRSWTFFREDGDGADLYERAATRAMGSDGWDPALRLWGTQMIEQTSLGIPGGIATPLKSTSVRINIHLHRQLFYNAGPGQLHDTDEDWTDL